VQGSNRSIAPFSKAKDLTDVSQAETAQYASLLTQLRRNRRSRQTTTAGPYIRIKSGRGNRRKAAAHVRFAPKATVCHQDANLSLSAIIGLMHRNKRSPRRPV
jgi:hypothetical protein